MPLAAGLGTFERASAGRGHHGGRSRERDLAIAEPETFESVTGKGVIGKVGHPPGRAGNARLMTDLVGSSLGGLKKSADVLRGEGATALYLAVDGKPGGVIAVADPIQADNA